MANLTTYREAEARLSNLGHRVVLVGTARHSRPCPKCGALIEKGREIINLGQIDGRWMWVCLACAPSDPGETPHLQDLAASPKRSRFRKPTSYTQQFITKQALERGWDWAGSEGLRCPVCDFEYVHPRQTEILDGEDSYQAWAGRGDLLSSLFWCDSGHIFSLNFGFHKGNMGCYWEHVADEHHCDGCRSFFEIEPGGFGLP
jgi:hypothetical protein